jgi:hypothetical protein
MLAIHSALFSQAYSEGRQSQSRKGSAAREGAREFMNYYLITGMAKSGTTWVQRICRAHPNMHCRTEDQFTKFWARITNITKDYNHLVDVRDRQRDRQGVEPLDGRDSLKLFYAMIRIALDKAPRDVDWSGIKDLTLSAHGFLRFLPNARVINVIRDPRDIAISGRAHSRRIDRTNDQSLNELTDNYVSTAAGHWLKQQALVESVRRDFPNRTHDIRYEDLINDFAPTVASLMRFFGTAHDPATIETLRETTDFKRLSGGRPQGQEDDSSYFRKGVAGDWRETLSPAQVTKIADICGAQLDAYGYDRK